MRESSTFPHALQFGGCRAQNKACGRVRKACDFTARNHAKVQTTKPRGTSSRLASKTFLRSFSRSTVEQTFTLVIRKASTELCESFCQSNLRLNFLALSGRRNHWVGVELIARQSNPDGIGAFITWHTQIWWRANIAIIVEIKVLNSPATQQGRHSPNAVGNGHIVEGFILIVVIQRMHLAVDVGDEQVGPAILLTSGETNSKGNSGDDAAPAQS